MHAKLGLLDVKLQELLVLDQTLDVKHLVETLNSVYRTVLEIHVIMLKEYATIMTIAQMLLLKHFHFAKNSLNNVFQQLQLVELLHFAINMKICFHAQLVLMILNVDGYQKVNAKITQHAVMQMVLTYQHVLVGVPNVFQMEPNVLIKELALLILLLQLVIMKALMDVVNGLEHPVD